MNEQSTLFGKEPERGRARKTDPDTSKEAAKLEVTGIQAEIMRALRYHGPLTAWEMHQVTEIALNTISPRTAALRKKGLIVESGDTRPGPTGKQCIVWKIKPQEG